MKLKLIVDGRGPVPGELLGKAALVVLRGNQTLLEKVRPGGLTSNQSEFIAIINGLSYLKEEVELGTPLKKATLLSDSQLAVNCITGVFKTKNEELKKLATEAKNLGAALSELGVKVSLEWTPRVNTKQADVLMRCLTEEAP